MGGPDQLRDRRRVRGVIEGFAARLLAERGLDDSWVTRSNPTARALQALDSEE